MLEFPEIGISAFWNQREKGADLFWQKWPTLPSISIAAPRARKGWRSRKRVSGNKINPSLFFSPFLGAAPNGPKSVAVFGDEAVVSYPARQGLLICNLISS